MKYILIFSLLFLNSLVLFPSSRADSLKQLLNEAKHDTVRYKLAYNIVLEIINTDHKEGLKYSFIEYQLASKYPEKYNVAEALQHIGYAYSFLGHYDSSIMYLNQGYELAKKDTGILAANICNILGGIYFDIGEYNRAQKYHLEALTRGEEQENKEFCAKVYNGLASTYIEMKYYDKAEEYLMKSLNYFLPKKNPSRLLTLYNNLGTLYSYEEEYEKALKYFNKCLELSKQINHAIGQAYSMANIGETWLRNNEPIKALEHYLEAEKIFKAAGMDYGLVGVKSGIASSYLETGSLSNAKKYFTEVLEIAESQGIKRYMKAAYSGLSELYEKQGNTGKALEYYKLFKSTTDSIFNEEKSRQIANMRIGYETEKAEQQIQLLQDQKELQSLRIKKQETDLRNQRYVTIGIILTAIVIILFGALLFRNNRLKQKSQYSELLRNHLELSLRFLRSQMNPHFIFNALGSIQGLVHEKKNDKAGLYLGKFSALMRGILENTSTSFIPLSEEIKILKLYMELEQMRFEDTFEFSIISENIEDEEEITVPPMTVQPFVENSIKHGLLKKDKKGSIEIRMVKNEGKIDCHITDNGIGRKAASNSKGTAGHISKGIQLVKDRLSQYDTEKTESYDVRYEDMFDENNNPAGTKVTVEIPFEERF